MSSLPFWDHVDELRKMLIRSGWSILLAALLAFCFHKELFTLLLAPLGLEKLYLLSPLEGFVTAAKISFWGGFVLASPLWLFFFFRFLFPALRTQERRLLIPFLVLSTLFVLGGALFAYKITLPCVSHYFVQFNAGLGENLWSFKETVNLTLGLILAHAIVFELYVILLFLIHFNLFTYPLLKKIRKVTIVAIFILAAILTPPDVLSQLLLAFPMLILFESALLYAKLKAGVAKYFKN